MRICIILAMLVYLPAQAAILAKDVPRIDGTPYPSDDEEDSLKLCPNGKYVRGNHCTMCPDGTYTGAKRCKLAPDGHYR